MRRNPRNRIALRIVSLAPNVTSILCSIGARALLVGVTRWCPLVAPVAHLPQLGDCWKLESVPEILKLKPDLVIGSVPFKTETVGKILQHPVRFLALNPRCFADIESDICLLAQLTGRVAAGKHTATKMRNSLAAIRKSIPRNKRPLRVYCEAWPNPRISSPHWVAELVELCGATIALPPGTRISEEQVRTARPDLIILAWAATGDRANTRKTYAVKQWQDVPAIVNNHVYVVRDELLNTPSPVLAQGAGELARILTLLAKNKNQENG